jgi:hypothetical protein
MSIVRHSRVQGRSQSPMVPVCGQSPHRNARGTWLAQYGAEEEAPVPRVQLVRLQRKIQPGVVHGRGTPQLSGQRRVYPGIN